MKRAFVTLGASVALLAFAGSVWDDGGAKAALEENVRLALGDRVRVDGTPLGCRVTRLPRARKAGLPGLPPCRRVGWNLRNLLRQGRGSGRPVPRLTEGKDRLPRRAPGRSQVLRRGEGLRWQ